MAKKPLSCYFERRLLPSISLQMVKIVSSCSGKNFLLPSIILARKCDFWSFLISDRTCTVYEGFYHLISCAKRTCQITKIVIFIIDTVLPTIRKREIHERTPRNSMRTMSIRLKRRPKKPSQQAFSDTFLQSNTSFVNYLRKFAIQMVKKAVCQLVLTNGIFGQNPAPPFFQKVGLWAFFAI